MKRILIALILLTCFLSANAAELSCACSEDSITHSLAFDNHETSEGEVNDHCQNTCTQCHFAALVPRYFALKADSAFIEISYLITTDISQDFKQLLYRPPIA